MPLRLTQFEFDQLTAKRQPGRRTVNRKPTGKKWEDMFAQQLDDAGIVGWLREHRFKADRRFRFDFAFPELQLAVEIDGAVHRIKKQFNNDRERGQVALLLGWRVLHVNNFQVRDGTALSLTKQLL